ncbi:MAG: T9SS C-terminal target domain-containing protein [Calditrichaeota bacterium]|nr:MAG: T9SS C-terminal target domain-containing protein [Calditrichota bacterium]
MRTPWLVFILYFTTGIFAGDLYLKLTWDVDPQEPVLVYYIHRGVTEQVTVLIDSVFHPTGEYYDYNISGGLRYYYRLQAKNVFGLTSGLSEARWGMIRPTAITLSPVGDHSVEIRWNTQDAYQTQVVYGTGYPPDRYSPLQTELTTDHRVVLRNLQGQTRYHIIGLAIDPLGNVVATQDTVFRTGGESGAPESRRNIVVYPNPFRGAQEAVYFFNVEAGDRVYVWNLIGEEIWKSAPAAGDRIRWDVKNSSAGPIRSGVYVFMIRNSEGRKVAYGKLVILR